MGDLFDKASAIWKALDEMADKSPEAYATFIQSQLEQGAQFFGGGKKGEDDGKEKTSGGRSGGGGTTTAQQSANRDKKVNAKVNANANVSVEDLLKPFSGLTLSPPPSPGGPASSPRGRGPGPKKAKKNDQSCDPETKEAEAETRPTLLDHDIGGSLLASIVKGRDEMDEEEEQNVKIQLIPSPEVKKTGKQQGSLIQEL